jgi:hypothetical protein
MFAGRPSRNCNSRNYRRIPSGRAASVADLPVAGIDERLLLGGSLAYETAHSWQAATQARRETKRCAEH